MNYYAVLSVPADADKETIRSAFRALARKYHPNAGEGSSSGKFRELVKAYETLIDPEVRRAYDRSLFTSQPRHRSRAPAEPIPAWRRPAAPYPQHVDLRRQPLRTQPSAQNALFAELFHFLEEDLFFAEPFFFGDPW